MERNFARLRAAEAETWSAAELDIETNAEVFHDLVEIHHELLTRAVDEGNRSPNRLDRALNLLAAKCVHLLRAAWIGTMCGYQGGYHPLIRALHETALTMLYLRSNPSDFGIWMKENKSAEEERRFWPSAMMLKLDLPDREFQLHKVLASQAHATASSVGLLGSYDRDNNHLEIEIGTLGDRRRLLNIASSLCLFAAVSALTIARTVRHAVGDGLPSQEAMVKFSERLQGLLDKREETEGPTDGTTVFEMLKSRRKPRED